MERGVGRLLLRPEFDDNGLISPHADRRTAFVVGRSHALTARHCLDGNLEIGNEFWLRLRMATPLDEPIFFDYPFQLAEASQELDAAVIVANTGSVDPPYPDWSMPDHSLLAEIALILDTTIPRLARITTEGYPVGSRSDGMAFSGRVVDTKAGLPSSLALQLQINELSSAFPRSPSGHSGGPVLYNSRAPASSTSVAVGLVRSFPAEGTLTYAIGGTLIASRMSDIVDAFPILSDLQAELRVQRGKPTPSTRSSLTSPEGLVAKTPVKVCQTAVGLQQASSLDVGAVVSRAGSSEWSERAARFAVSGHVPQASRILLSRIRDCRVTVPSWNDARTAANLLSPAFRERMEAQVGNFLQDSDVERQRHAIVALGRMGATDYAESVVSLAGRDSDRMQKLGGSTIAALSWLFVHAEEASVVRMNQISSLLLEFVNSDGSDPPFPWDEPFGNLTPAHIDTLVDLWITADNRSIRNVAASALGNLRAERALMPIIERIDELRGVGCDLLYEAIGQIGSPAAFEALRLRADSHTAARSAMSFCLREASHDVFDDTVEVLLTEPNPRSFLVLRAIGLRDDSDHIKLLERELTSGDSWHRATAMLGLARRLGPAASPAVRRAFETSSTNEERIFGGLAVLRLEPSDQAVKALEQACFEQPLLPTPGYLALLFEDVISELRASNHHHAGELAASLEWFKEKP